MGLEKRYTDDTDPLADYAVDHVDDDPNEYFEKYLEKVETRNGGISERTRGGYTNTWNMWVRHMNQQAPERPPVLPRKGNVVSFIERLDRGDTELQRPHKDGEASPLVPHSIQQHVSMLRKLFETLARVGYLPNVANPAFDTNGSDAKMTYNPFEAGMDATNLHDRAKAARQDSGRNYPHLSWDEIRGVLADVNSYRDKAVIGLQLKLGCRAGELSGMELGDIHIGFDRVHDYYTRVGRPLGTHPELNGHEHAVIIPSDREGNKSQRDRIIPLDGEARRLLYAWLLVRPDARDEAGVPRPWVFLSTTRHGQLRREAVTRTWKCHFDRFDPPEDSDKDPIRSHYARHKATSYWSDDPDMTMRLLKYFRGDIIRSEGPDSGGAVDSYLHANYQELEPIYRARPPRLLGE